MVRRNANAAPVIASLPRIIVTPPPLNVDVFDHPGDV